ncbi:MAG: lipoyl(octanoyl) transferase LipB [Pseudobdellovibrio sp.]
MGRLGYEDALIKQDEYHQLARQNPNTLYILGLEHPQVLTLGYRADESAEIFAANRVPVVKTQRGGLATIHSEGQLIIYPIMNLRHLQVGVRDFVLSILNCTQSLLSIYGVQAQAEERAVGLYTQKGKIAFCGIQIKNGISLHGLSLNVSNDLSLFSNIMACGVHNQKLDSMVLHGVHEELEVLFSKWVELIAVGESYFKRSLTAGNG